MTWRDVIDGSADYAIVRGDALDSLRALPDECIQCVVTSPPYYGLRDYGLPPSIWGGRVECPHEWGGEKRAPGWISKNGQGSTSLQDHGDDGRSPYLDQLHENGKNRSGGTFCVHCNAWRGCLGLEPTPAMFLDHLVELFREVWRVLRRDGVAFVNLGDSYSGSGKGPTGHNGIGDQGERQGFTDRPTTPDCWGLKPKDLMLMPERFAIAMVADGWWLRSAITWCKSSAMPESVRDRPTSATERIYLLSKSATYFYDSEAVREPPADYNRKGGTAAYAGSIGPQAHSPGMSLHQMASTGANLRNFWPIPNTRPMLRLREDLTPEQRAYVLRRLADGIGRVDHA